MRDVVASRIMPRTTIDIDPVVLQELKRRQAREGKTLGHLVSEMLASALVDAGDGPAAAPFTWTSRRMGARVDLEDKEAVRRAIGEP